MKTKLVVLIVVALALILLPSSVAFAGDGAAVDTPATGGSGFPVLGIVLFAAPAAVALAFGAYQYLSRM